MPQRKFNLNVDDHIYQTALQRAQGDGKVLESVLTEFVRNYAGGYSGEQTKTYTVQSGDTLIKIARKFYGDPYKYPLIQQANNISEAGVIWVGQVLTIPPMTDAPSSSTTGVVAKPTPTSPTPTSPTSSSSPQQPEPSPSPAPESAHATLLNGDFEEFQARLNKGKPSYWKEPRFPEEYGKYWQVALISEVDKGRTRFMSSPVFGQFAQAYFGGQGLNYAYGGGNSQVIAAQYGYDVVFRQTVAAQPGHTYTFSGLIVSFYKGTDNPATPDKIFKRLGIDPTGGADYTSSNVVWNDRDSTDHAWINPNVTATAQANQITVFIRIENTEENVGVTDLNLVHLDKFRLD